MKSGVLKWGAGFLVLNKPAGTHFNQLKLPHGVGHYVPVHRIDFATSGCLLFSDPRLEKDFRRMFQDRIVQKTYLAGASRAVEQALGHITLTPNQTKNKTFEIHGFICARYRRSQKVRFSWEPLPHMHSFQDVHHTLTPSAVRPPRWIGHCYQVELHSGARHQIRAFFAALDAPLVGDPIYGKSESVQISLRESAPDPRAMELMSWKIGFRHPETDEDILVEAPITE